MSDPNDLTTAEQVMLGRNLQRIARLLDRELKRATGGKRVPFSLYTWANHRAQYVSNAPREAVKAGMRELLEKWDTGDEGPFDGRGMQ